MSAHNTPEKSDDVVESIVPLMPIVLPVGGGILIFLLAFIAVFMATAYYALNKRFLADLPEELVERA